MTLEVEDVTTIERLDELGEEWAQLHAVAGSGSPFEHPAWAGPWAREFVDDGDLACVAVRDDALSGALVGFAGLYRRQHAGAGLKATSLQPLGTGRGQALTEVTQVLCAPGTTQKVLPAVVRHLEQVSGWNWLQLTIGPTQGWFVPQWLQQRAASVLLHRGVRPCVVFGPLPNSREALLHGLKRNVRESVRRGTNRTRKLEGLVLRSDSSPSAVARSLDNLVALHRQRAAMEGKVAHTDLLASAHQRDFLTTATQLLAAQGLARIQMASHEGRDVAGVLVLSNGRSDYLSLTGLDPAYWDLNLNTLLVFESLVEAVRLEREMVNLSTGPDESKLRWSSAIATYHDFAVVRGDLRSRAAYGAFSHISLARRHGQEHLRHRRST